MYTILTSEMIITNALIEILERTGRTEISIQDVYTYSDEVAKVLKKQGHKVMNLVRKGGLVSLTNNYPRLFYMKSESKTLLFGVHSNITPDLLKARFRQFLPEDYISAMTDSDALAKLNISE
jgi:hypothetical protein